MVNFGLNDIEAMVNIVVKKWFIWEAGKQNQCVTTPFIDRATGRENAASDFGQASEQRRDTNEINGDQTRLTADGDHGERC